ncbi:Monoacylglycerol lipase ABHD12 [Nosema granulosis]|uniref:Monoacylglycerol lipase ABHD12 n=1 Tax=Nosema granulosis TaxID=83296 RepID=A0A9P6L0G8_9MICR|nr:Monoacylglycerol lipase ABHD12 [Nosema granulosis]
MLMNDTKPRIKIYYSIAVVFLSIILLLNQFLFTFQRVWAFKFKKSFEMKANTQILDQNGQNIDIYIVDKESDTDLIFIHGSIASGKVYRQTLDKMAEKTNCNVIGYYFRGMNNKRGQPTEKSIVEESFLVGDFVKSRGKKLIIYGQSLGCSVALSLANYLNIQKTILENPFTKYIEIIKNRSYVRWFYYLVVDTWDNIKRIEKYKGDLLIFTSENDTIVPSDNSYRLSKLHKGTKVQKLAGNTHFDVQKNVNYHNYICDFINQNSQ